MPRCPAVQEVGDSRVRWAGGCRSLLGFFPSSIFFLIASSLLFLAAIFWGKTREALKRALKQIKFGKIEFI
jgi:hypothetical protein